MWTISRTPIDDMLNAYIHTCRIRMHMPGGKGKTDDGLFDVTETAGTDNLGLPVGAIKEAQELLAEACGAKGSFFLVGGSSLGLQAAILYACYEGKLLLSRDSHRMCINALALSGGEAIFMDTPYIPEEQLFMLPDAETVEGHLKRDSNISAVLITYPNYYGACCDVGAIAEVVHRYGKLLIVDEAHGAHLPYSELLPPSSGKMGADIWIQSAHKTLPAMTQGAYLHCGEGVNGEGMMARLRVLQTTSPSFILMRSLDRARAEMSFLGEKEYKRLYNKITAIPSTLDNGITRACFSALGAVAQDFSRLVFDVRGSGYSGMEVEAYLQSKGIYVEMSDVYRVVCILSICDTEADIDAVVEALNELPPKGEPYHFDPVPVWGEGEKNIRGAMLGKRAYVPLAQAAGRVSADVIGAYPPGGCLVAPGEHLTAETVDYIRCLLSQGITVMGVTEGMVQVVSES